MNNLLDDVYYRNSLESWGISLLIILGAVLLNKLISILNQKVFKKLAQKTASQVDDLMLETMESPLLYAIILGALWVAFIRLDCTQEAKEVITKIYKVLVTLDITWFIARFITSYMESHSGEEENATKKKKVHFDSRLLPLVKRGVLIIIWIIGILTALGNIGVNIGTLLGTLGIGGIAFALAAQDTIKNIFGGITILTDRPFRIGDVIRFDAVEGTVEDIGLRSTRIMTYDKQLLAIPNYKVMDAIVVNISKEPGRRVVNELGLTYDTTPEKMEEAIEILKNIPNIVAGIHHRDTIAVFSSFESSSLNITFIYFIRKGKDIRATKSEVNFEILRAFNKAGISFAFPSQTIYLEK